MSKKKVDIKGVYAYLNLNGYNAGLHEIYDYSQNFLIHGRGLLVAHQGYHDIRMHLMGDG